MSFVYMPENFLILGPFVYGVQPLHLYLGFAVMLFWLYKTRQKAIDTKQTIMLFLVTVFCALAGGRLYHFLSRWQGPETLQLLFDLSRPGLTSFGMVLGGIIGMSIFSAVTWKKKKWGNFLDLCDVLAPAVCLWIFIYRISSFPHGSVPGTPTQLPWGVFAIHYQQHSGIIMHPTALYLSFSALLIFIFLHWFKKRQQFAGQIALLFLIMYSFNRFWIEFLRWTHSGGLSSSQIPAIIIFVLACIGFGINYYEHVYKKKKGKTDRTKKKKR